jgi:DHA1 family bicyclomycin/chloramphenicol resistance-like MFS transporter
MSSAAKSRPMPFAEIVAFTAAVLALNALAIDMMLPALGLIGAALGAAGDNDRQLIVVVYVVANGIAQPFFGPLADRFGRRPALLAAFAGYILGSALSVVAGSFALLLAARALQGAATAAARVAILAVVRDQCAGRRMAEVMSLAITVFMAAPIVAPALGQLLLFAAPWRGIFVALLLYGGALALWTFARAPETLPREARIKLDLAHVAASYREFLRTRQSVGYTLVAGLFFGALFGYVSAAQQIFVDTFRLGPRFPFAFSTVAASLALATLVNARLVGRIGMRRLLHGAALLFLAANLAHFALAIAAGDGLAVFLVFMALSFFALGLIGANSTALAMEPMGHIAGAAAAANGFLGATLAGVLGGLIGRAYDGTTRPVVAGFLALGLAGVLVILWAEKGRLFALGRREAEAA